MLKVADLRSTTSAQGRQVFTSQAHRASTSTAKEPMLVRHFLADFATFLAAVEALMGKSPFLMGRARIFGNLMASAAAL
jgi:hypothetical protein